MVGVGSPAGDDRVGWEVVLAFEAELRNRPFLEPCIRTRACDRPGAALVNLLDGFDRAVIVDAARGPYCRPGTVRWLDERGLHAFQSTSTHGFGVAEALALGRAMGNRSCLVDVLAVCTSRFEGDTVSEVVRAAVPVAVEIILARLLNTHVVPRDGIALTPSNA